MSGETQVKHVGVIGSGLGGLAAACTLASRGHRARCSGGDRGSFALGGPSDRESLGTGLG